ncbi:MAG: hypothetical protein RLZZ15_1711 [Verrucomicrobiota bacterium]|jgi:uncharacterized protein (TIGR03663 family)
MVRWILLPLIAFAALWLRTHDLAARPMHADEANQAVKFGELLEHGRYAFDPRDHHGPTLYYAALPIAWARGQTTLAALDETTVRLVPAFAGTASVLLIFVLALPLGTWPALMAAALLAVSPPSVYYARYYVQETLLVTFTLALCVCAREWWRRRTPAWALAAGACLGLMQATKASAPIFVLAALAAAWIASRLAAAGAKRDSEFVAPASAGTDRSAGTDQIPAEAGASNSSARSASLRAISRALALALAAAFAVAALFYSSFGTHLAGLRDAVATYGATSARLDAGLTGHEKPWWYYASLFGWERRTGVVFEQVAFSLLALAGGALALRSATRGTGLPPRDPSIVLPSATSTASPANRLLLFAALYVFFLFACLSFPAYKTPWHAIHFVPPLALLAAAALRALALPRSTSSLLPGALAAALALLSLATLAYQTRLTSFLRPADPRNPYAYVHTSRDALKIPALATAALAATAAHFSSQPPQPAQPIRVISEEYWPLPWYFRGFEKNVGYWPAPPADCDGPLVLASEKNAAAVRARLRGAYAESIVGLRPGFILVVFTRLP